ncbi:MAG: cell division protein FtsZ [Chloroflexi bacterium RBG_13_51_52]|nr:MAG: cell division protein FtsZ [Chloroflexi bacterium RBG_13_51_52]
MKLVVVGFGQCGGRIADEFARLNKRARGLRGLNVITGAYAVNTDVADMSGLTTIKSDYNHRILIGNKKTQGHGVGKINELGAEIAHEDADKVIETIRSTEHFAETDAFLLVAGAAGGTGSGAIAVMTQQIKERYVDKPVYNLIVLPFEHEVVTEERTVYNVATCLKSSYLVADAIFLVDNQRYVMKDASLTHNLHKINQIIVQPFFNLLCAGEEKKTQYIGAKILDAGDIIQTLVGWTTLGYGQSQTSIFKTLLKGARDFRDKATETQRGIHALDEAISSLSIKCNPVDSKRALYLISAPAKEINVDLIKELGTYIKNMAPEAVIRSGDYPREKGNLDVTLILSEMSDVEKVRSYFTKAINLIAELKKRQEGIVSTQRGIDVSIKDIPSLL